MITKTERMVELLVEVFALWDDKPTLEKTAKLLAREERRSMKAWREKPFDPHLKVRAPNAILASAMLCKLQGNDLGYQDARFRRLKELGC